MALSSDGRGVMRYESAKACRVHKTNTIGLHAFTITWVSETALNTMNFTFIKIKKNSRSRFVEPSSGLLKNIKKNDWSMLYLYVYISCGYPE